MAAQLKTKRKSVDEESIAEKKRKRKEERESAANAYKKALAGTADEADVKDAAAEGPPLAPEATSDCKVFVVLENASLEVAKTSKGHKGSSSQLLSGDDHKGLLKKSGRDPSTVRPDIAHQCLLALLDSPLNKAGRLKVFIRTVKNVLIEVHPDIRIPRTYKRFSGLMAELLNKYKIRATNSQDTLLKVIRNPVVAYLPVGSRKYLFSYSSEKMVNVVEHAKDVIAKEKADSVVYVIGAMAAGKVEVDWVEDDLSVSHFPLSGACVCNRLTHAYELALNIL